MKVLTLVLLILSAEYALAENTVTSVFTDSQFTASPYGIEVARQCLNPGNAALNDSSAVRFFANPGGHTQHLLTNANLPRLGNGQSHVWTYLSTADGVTNRTQTQNAQPKTYFDAQINDPQVHRIMIFMGINEVDSRNQNWKAIADRLQSSGKECFVSLPPLVNSESWNRRIMNYNRHVQQVLAGTQCRIIDPSNTLSQSSSDDLRFNTSDGVHFASSQASRLAQATCEALAESSSSARSRDPIVSEELPFLQNASQ